jgi:hypothetical protein
MIGVTLLDWRLRHRAVRNRHADESQRPWT